MAETIAGGRVLIADDHPLIREGLGLAARAAMPGVTVEGEMQADAALNQDVAIRKAPE